jgi:hypothetical protein
MFRSTIIILQLISVHTKTLQRHIYLKICCHSHDNFGILPHRFRPTCDIGHNMVTSNFGLKRKVTDKLTNGRSPLTIYLMDIVWLIFPKDFSNIFGCAQLQPDLLWSIFPRAHFQYLWMCTTSTRSGM